MAIGGHALDGVTTISPTARYYALRCWIVYRYALASLPDSYSQFLRFAERVEAGVVLGNLLVDPTTTGLIGSTKGHDLLASGEDPLPLVRLVNQLAVSAYAGPSDHDQLGLTYARPSGVPGLTEERGLPLAAAVDEMLAETAFAKQLARRPKTRSVSRKALRQLGRAYPIGRPKGQERDLLLDALLPPAPKGAEMPRTASYALLLWLADRDGGDINEWTLFQEAVSPSQDLPAVLLPLVDQWLLYLVRDTLAVCHERVLEAIHATILQRATEAGWVRTDEVLESLVGDDDALVAHLSECGIKRVGKSALRRPLAHFEERVAKSCGRVREVSESVRRWDGELDEIAVQDLATEDDASATVALLVAWLLAEQRVGQQAPPDSAAVEILSYQGGYRLGLREVVLPTLRGLRQRGLTFRECLAELVLVTADQHLSVAWNRAAQDPSGDVATIAVDGASWMRVQEFQAGRMASRLRQATGYLTQLGLFTAGKGLTTLGRRHHQRAVRMLREAEAGDGSA